MCRLNITIDQSVHTLAPVFQLIDATSFIIRSVRLAPVAHSSMADVYFSLSGGSKPELETLLGKVRDLPAVGALSHAGSVIWGRRGLDSGPAAR